MLLVLISTELTKALKLSLSCAPPRPEKSDQRNRADLLMGQEWWRWSWFGSSWLADLHRHQHQQRAVQQILAVNDPPEDWVWSHHQIADRRLHDEVEKHEHPHHPCGRDGLPQQRAHKEPVPQLPASILAGGPVAVLALSQPCRGRMLFSGRAPPPHPLMDG